MAPCGIGKSHNCWKFGTPLKIRGASSSSLKEATIVINTLVSRVILALSYCLAQASNKFRSPRKVSSTIANVHVPAAAVDAAVFSGTTEHHSETKHARGCFLFHLYVVIVVQ